MESTFIVRSNLSQVQLRYSWTNVARTNVGWTNITMNLHLKFGQHWVRNYMEFFSRFVGQKIACQCLLFHAMLKDVLIVFQLLRNTQKYQIPLHWRDGITWHFPPPSQRGGGVPPLLKSELETLKMVFQDSCQRQLSNISQ